MNVPANEPIAIALVEAIRGGDLAALKRLLSENPNLATARIIAPGKGNGTEGGSRSLLHIATDWPGHFPRVVETIATLIEYGADVNALGTGTPPETPLHWAASSDDIAALDALLDAGADMEAQGSVIGGGTPMADAVAFGQWKAARRLLERGARTNLWQSAALGLLDRMTAEFVSATPPAPDDITNAFWCACQGGQRQCAEHLLQRGADLNWVGHNGLTPIDAAYRSGATELVAWLRGIGAQPGKVKPAQ